MVESVTETATRLLKYQMQQEIETSALFDTLILTGRPNTTVSQTGTKRPGTPQDQRINSNPYPSMDKSG